MSIGRYGGVILIDSDKIYKGMISIGNEGMCLFYPHRGATWQNHGGTVVFKGRCHLGAGSSISINKNARLEIGDDMVNTYGLKMIVSRNITIGKSCRFGWNTFVMDTNMHPLKDSVTHKKGSGGKSISIGDFNWFSSNCTIMPGVVTPERVICGYGTVVTRGFPYKSYCMFGGSPIRLLRENVFRDYNDDKDEAVFVSFKNS